MSDDNASKGAYTSKNGWGVYKDKAVRKKMTAFCDDYVDFLSTCKTERETVAWCENVLKGAGFTSDPASGAYVTNHRGKALFAFRKGKRPLSEGLRLIASHGDCPRLDFKQHPFVEQAGFAQAKTHYYGGIRKYQWLARPLALHGVIARDDGKLVEVRLGEEANEPVFTIDDLLPHLAQKQVTKSVREAFQGEKLNVILASMPKDAARGKEPKNPVKTALLDLLLERYEVREEDFVSAEIEVVPAGRASYVGLDASLVGGYGQDDHICVYTSLRAFLDKKNDDQNCVLLVWDREEIGSDGDTGANSRFLEYCLADVVEAHEPKTSLRHVLLASDALSADVTAAMDPDYQDVHEKTNAARIGHGICFEKYGGHGGKYGASEAHAEFFGRLRGVLNKAGIPWQASQLGYVDHGGGGTVALFLASLGMNVIDSGPALLSMHSPFELASVPDIYSSYQTYMAFYEN